jgi:hypothetical protein
VVLTPEADADLPPALLEVKAKGRELREKVEQAGGRRTAAQVRQWRRRLVDLNRGLADLRFLLGEQNAREVATVQRDLVAILAMLDRPPTRETARPSAAAEATTDGQAGLA